MEAHERLIEYRNKYLNRSDEKINQEYLSMIDSVLDEYRAIKIELERKEEYERRLTKYCGIRCIDRILNMNNIIYSFFDDMVNKYDLNYKQIFYLVHDISDWELRADAVLSEYQFYSTVQYLYITAHDTIKDDTEFLSWCEQLKQFSQKHNCKIICYINYKDYLNSCTTFLSNLRNKYFIYLDTKYKQLCQTTKY